MKRFVYIAIILLFIPQAALAIPPKKLYDITLEDVQGAGRLLNLSFYNKVPPAPVVDKILKESLDHAILIDFSKDILATGFLGDDVLNNNQYSGSLIYVASKKKTFTFDEYRGIKTSNINNTNYFVEFKEDRTLEGIKPKKKWLTITLVFAKRPSQGEAYNAIITEAQKLTARGLDMNFYASVGDKNAKTSWKQIRDTTDGTYIAADYNADSKILMHQNNKLKQF